MTDESNFILGARWRLGHRAFDIILEAIIKVLIGATQAMDRDDFGGLRHSLAKLASLLESATEAMHFAADFAAADYRNLVRPTMEPPHVPPGFSGTLNERHAEFLERFRSFESRVKTRFGDCLEAAPADLAESWRTVLKMRSKNLAAHGLVCERFVPGGESLLKQHLKSKKEEEQK